MKKKNRPKIKAFSMKDLKEKMNKNNVDNLSELSNSGTLGTSNFGGIFILTNVTGEEVFVQEIWDNGEKDIESRKLYHDKKGAPYFRYKNEHYNLDEFIKNIL